MNATQGSESLLSHYKATVSTNAPSRFGHSFCVTVVISAVVGAFLGFNVAAFFDGMNEAAKEGPSGLDDVLDEANGYAAEGIQSGLSWSGGKRIIVNLAWMAGGAMLCGIDGAVIFVLLTRPGIRFRTKEGDAEPTIARK